MALTMNTHNKQQQDRVVLLLDLDCFYAQCERIRLGFTDHNTCCLALLQWNSCLAVSYPARVYGIKRGDSFQEVATKSQGKCLAVHVPLLETNHNNSIDFDGTYESNYCLSQDEQQQLRHQDIGRRRYATEGKACLERYRVASRRIFEVVQECLGMTNINSTTTASNMPPMPKTGIILEKASIDEFFLDVTAICNNPEHPLWELIQNQASNSNTDGSTSNQSDQDASTTTSSNNPQHHKTVIVGADKNDDHESPDLMNTTTTNHDMISDPALERGCQLAHYIRQSVFRRLGFTVSAGCSINKMVAKLAASYGKPNGQAIVLPHLIPSVMHSTKLSKVRNFGGKLGKALLELLPSDAPPTMGSISQYLSLPQLQEHFGSSETAQMIHQACRGHDNEPVEAKNTGNVVKSITAFKSLPKSASDADIEDAAFQEWLELLVKEVVSRVETDAQRNHRYPRNATLQYGCVGQLNASGRLDMKSFRVPFPSQRWNVAQRIAHLMEVIPSKIIAREQQPLPQQSKMGTGGRRRKRIRISRIGVCATEMNEEVNKHGSIANYFSAAAASSTSATTKKSASKPAKKVLSSPKESLSSPTAETTACDLKSPKISNPYRKKESSAKTPATGSSSARPSRKDDDEGEEDEDLKVARELQKAYDRENRTLNIIDKTCSSRASSSKESTRTAAFKQTDEGKATDNAVGKIASGTVATKSTRAQPFSPSTTVEGSASLKEEPDPDLELAKRLQASYDRESRVLGAWDSVQKKRVLSNSSSTQAPKKKTNKTQKISSFFQQVPK